jgi:hypothetical protein
MTKRLKLNTEGDSDSLTLSLEIHPHGELEFHYNYEELDYVTFGQKEFNPLCDDNYAIYFREGNGYYSLAELISEVNCQIGDIIDETVQEELEELQMKAELSSPYYTGRI